MNTTHEHEDFESRLRSLTPAPIGLDRDAMLFEAGRASARPATRRWQGVCGLLVAMLLVSVLSPVQSPTGQAEIIADHTPAPAAPNIAFDHEPAVEMASYLRLRTRVLEQGLDALNGDTPPRGTSEPLKPLTPHQMQQLLEELL